MKNILLCLLVGLSMLCSKLNSQNSQLEDQILDALSTLDQSQVPSGLLYERIPEYYAFSYFRGKYIADSTSVYNARYSMMTAMMGSMSIQPNPLLPTLDSMVKEIKYWAQSDSLILGLLYYKYDRLRPDAIKNQWIEYHDEHFYDVKGRSGSPYQSDSIFIASLYDNKRDKLDFSLVLPSILVRNNLPYESIELDADDGLGYRTILFDQVLQLSYSDYGIKKIKIKLILVTGEVLLSQTLLKLVPKKSGLTYNINADDSITLSGVNLYWWYNKNCGDHKIRKPLILIEGFDPLNTLSQKVVFKKYGGEDFGLLNGIYGDLDKIKLSEYLHDDDYDVFYIDYKEGHIAIQHNAYYVTQAIQWINERKHKDGSFEKNIVIGASMGGVVGYYALKSMENQRKDHEAEFFLSVDSPLKGANIPIGMQAFIQELGDYKLAGFKLKDLNEESGLHKGVFALNSPAAKQLLYYHYDSPAWSDCGGIDGDCTETFANNLSSVHNTFYSELEALGTLNIKHYSISNGSILRKEQQFGIGEKLADAYITTDELLDEILPLGFIWDASEYLFIKGLRTGFFSKHIVHSLNTSGKHRVYYGGFGQVILNIPIVKIIERHVKDALPYDSAPGGMRIFEKGLTWNFESFCFIPTISSLKLSTTDPYYTDVNGLDDVEKTIASGITSLDFYSGSLERKPFFDKGTLFWNEDHVSLNKRLAEFLRLLVGYKTIHVDNPLDARTFNFGDQDVTIDDLTNNRKTRIRNVINYDLDITNSGKLIANKYDKIGYTDDSNNPLNKHNWNYDLNIIQDCIDTTVVLVKSNGELIVGDKIEGNNTANLNVMDSARLIASSNGKITIDEDSRLNVYSGGIVTIVAGGKILAGYNAKIIVKEGGVLHIKAGGILELIDNGQLIVEPWGTIIIDKDAILRMKDGDQTTDGRCNVTISGLGKMIYNGAWVHDGNGYVQFNSENELIQNETFSVTGIAKGIRTIRLAHSAVLKINDKGIILGKGKVDYEPHSSISIGDDGLVNTNMMVFNGTVNFVPSYSDLTIALSGNKSGTITVNRSDFRLLYKGIQGDFNFAKMTTGNLLLTNSTFNEVERPLTIIAAYKARLDSVFIDKSNYSSFAGTNRVDNNKVMVSNSGTGFNINQVKYFVLTNSAFSKNQVGIKGNSSNCFVYKSSFTNNELGISIPFGSDLSGLVECGCSSFIDNGISIHGEDVLLSISPLSVNASGLFPVGNNNFVSSNLSNMHFYIYLNTRNYNLVSAEYNYWGGGLPPSDSYFLSTNGVTSDIPLISYPYYNTFRVDCPRIIQGIGGNGTCGYNGGPFNLPFNDIRDQAMQSFQTDQSEITETLMQDISSSQNDNYAAASSDCKFTYDYARIFTQVALNPTRLPILSDADDYTLPNKNIHVSPNPIHDFMNITLPRGEYTMSLFNGFGKLIFKKQLNGNSIIDTKSLIAGLYYYTITNAHSKIIYSSKVEKLK